MLLNDMFLNNKWLWFHMLASAILTKILLLFFHPQTCVAIVFIGATIWEIIEYLKNDVEKIYGSFDRFYQDSIGDIIGALLISIIIAL